MSTENEKRERRFAAWWSARGYRQLDDRPSPEEYDPARDDIKFGWAERDLMEARRVSELEQRFEAWWADEGCNMSGAGVSLLAASIEAGCRAAWMNGADVQKHSTKEQG